MAHQFKAGTAGQAAALPQPTHCPQEMTMNTTTATAATSTTPARVTFAEACIEQLVRARATLPDTDGVEDVRAHGLRIVIGNLMESLDDEAMQAHALMTEAGVVLDLVRRSLVADGDKAPPRTLPLIDLARADLAEALACGTGA
jgi:hypothetical protein